MNGMKIYHNMKELVAEAPLPILLHLYDKNCDTNFEIWFGGNVYEIENEEDLKEITGWKEEGWFQTLDQGPCSFDICDWLNLKQLRLKNLEKNKWVEIFLVTTNSGGPAYFIPGHIALKCPNVLKSIELTKER